jgi:hypothetical protein
VKAVEGGLIVWIGQIGQVRSYPDLARLIEFNGDAVALCGEHSIPGAFKKHTGSGNLR